MKNLNRSEKIDLIKQFARGIKKVDDFIEKHSEVWIEDISNNPFYNRQPDPAIREAITVLSYDDLVKRRKTHSRKIHFITLHLERKIDPLTPGYLTLLI